MRDVIVLTGGAGFIGCALASSLDHQDKDVVAIDIMHPQVHKSEGRPAKMPGHVELIVADVRDAKFWDKFLAENYPAVIVHLAAETGTAQSLTQSTRHSSVNVVGTSEMLDALARAETLPGHILLASSRAVYGEGAWKTPEGVVFYPPLRTHDQLTAGHWDCRSASGPADPVPHRAKEIFPNPASIYGATKLAQEHIILAWGAAMKVPVSIFRLQNVYGPGQSPHNPYTGIINLFHRIAYNGGVIEIYEDGNIGRDFVFIDDVASVIATGIAKPPGVSRLLDVGTGAVTTIAQAAKYIAAIHGAPEPCVTGRFRDGDVRWAVADVRDLYAELGMCCGTQFLEQGASIVGDWLIEQDMMK